MRIALRRAVLGFSLLFLGACAPLKDPWGMAVRRGEVVEAPVRPDSLQADIGIEPRESGLLPFTARVYAKPLHNYRIDAFGFPSMIAASYLWRDGKWMWVRHDKKQVREGEGDELEIEDSPLRLPDVHAVLGFLWGSPMPGFDVRNSTFDSLGVVRWTYRDEPWEAQVDSRGLCRVVRSSKLRLEYGGFRRLDGRVLPGEAKVFVEGEWVVTLRLRDLNSKPSWKRDPFALVPPNSYKRVP